MSSYFEKIMLACDEIINVAKTEDIAWLPFSCTSGLIGNAEFESDFSGWDFYSNAQITNDAFYGIKAAEITGGAGGVGKNIGAFENEVFSLEVMAKKSGAENALIGIKFLDAGYNEISAKYEEITSGNFQSYQISARAPAGTSYAQALGWKNDGSGSAIFDGFCFQKWEQDSPICSDKSCELSPSWGNYVWSLDDSGYDNHWMDYDDGGLILCKNSNGTLGLKGNVINGHDADWSAPTANPCGTQDGWYLDLTLSDRQDWTTFQGSYVQNAGCGSNHVDWDYWQIAGTLTGTGCNSGRTITINGSSNGYRAQVGWGGNSQSCDFGISVWLSGTEYSNTIKADLYAHLDAVCYQDLLPEDCVNGIDDDGDGLADCYDSDCAPQILQNESFENTGGINFNTTFEGSPAYALDNGSTLLPDWRMDYSCSGTCYDSYWINDSADEVNNPNGDYFLWVPGSSYCARQSIDVDVDKCYEITFVAAAWSVPAPQTPTTIAFEAFGGGIDDNGSLLTFFETELPASPDWNHLNWQTITFTWSPPASATTSFYISQSNTSLAAKGVAIDQVLIKEICCANGSVVPEISCEEGRDVELQFVGINKDIPNSLNISDLNTIDSIIVEVVYKGGHPGSSITVEAADGTSYAAARQSVGSNAYVYRMTLPPTSSINYSNTNNENKAQSLSAFIFRNNQPGKTVVTEFTTIGGYNNTYTLDFNIPKGLTNRNINLALPISEITYDNRSLDFVATAGDVSVAKSRSWGPGESGFPNGCCIDSIHFFLPNVAPDVELVTVDVISSGSGGQSFVIAATIAVEIFCEEICGNGVDDDGDGFVDNEDQDCLCPEIYSEDNLDIEICEGETVTFEVATNAPNPPYQYIEFYRFDTPQTNPYLATDPKVWLDAFYILNEGPRSVTTDNFQAQGNSDKTYYVYGCLKPEPQDPETCYPFIEYVVTVKPGTVVSVSADATICSGTTTNLSATASGGPGPYSYEWDQGLGSGANQNVSPTSNTAYTVTVTNGNGCTYEDLVIISVTESPSVDAGQDVTICPNESTTLNATGSGGTTPYSFQWSHGLGAGDSQIVSPPNTRTYTVTLTSNNGCLDADAVTVTVDNCIEICTNNIDDDGDGLADCDDPDCAPVPFAGNDVSICLGTSTTLSASVPNGVGSFTYAWSNGLGAGANQTVTPLSTTTFTVTVTNVAGCTGTAEVTVTVNNCPEVCADGVDNDGDGLIDCDDPDCYAIGAPSLLPDEFTTCPTLPLTDRVNFNDENLQDPVYNIFSMPTGGTLTMDATGKFTYTPFMISCGVDSFQYEVCNQTTGCCAAAWVVVNIGDQTPPNLMNVPADMTISCDEQVPDPTIVLAFDECPGIYIDFDETTDQYQNGGCEGYQITRTWIAEDLCGNTVADTQIISVEDLEGPELFQVYTLPSGKKLLAGVSQLVTQNWKYVSFPIQFAETPLVFSQVISSNEASAVVPFHRNISDEGFEINLNEQEGSDKTHQQEHVAWLAIEPGSLDGVLEAGLLNNVNNTLQTLNLGQSFPNVPLLLSSTQTVNEIDPYSVRFAAATPAGVDLYLAEETSKDTETTHADESLAYLAIAPDENLLDQDGDPIGETGSLNLTNAWATVSLDRTYSKTVVLFGAISSNDPDPVTVRVRNVTSNSFEVRLQEWDSQDGVHAVENVDYLVVEGGLSADKDTYCNPDEFKYQAGVNVFVRDNCDNQVNLDYAENSTMQPDGLQISRLWSTADDCGNVLSFVRNDNCTVASIRLKALLYGAVMDNIADTLMTDHLRSQGILPETEPYSDLSYFAHKGRGGGETVFSPLLNVTGEDAIVDWLFIEVRDSANASDVIATQAVLVKRNGELMSPTGEDVIYFPNLREGSYNVAYRHRNHLGIMAGHPWYLSSVNIPTLDFSDVNVAVFQKGTSSTVVNGRRVAWAGDFNGDRKIIYQGPQNDIFYLFSKVLSDPGNSEFLANYISYGYDRTDIDLDGKIIYQGPDNERAKLLYHTTLSHPVNTGFLANYIVLEQLP
ncbi:MAG: Ig-like domain-containing protein [Bacteroidota bacterium]